MWKSQRNNDFQTFATKKPQFQWTCKTYHYQPVNKYLQMQENSFYQKLNVDSIAKHSGIVNSAITINRQLLSKSTGSKLTKDEVRTHQFCIFLKVHKPNLPRRPVVGSVEVIEVNFKICWSLSSVNCQIIAFIYKRYFRFHQQNQWNKIYK